MPRQPLNSKHPRFDVSLGNESTALCISSGNVKSQLDCTTAGLTPAATGEQLIYVQLDEDNGITARLVFGKLNKQEEDEWFERGSRVLDLSDGVLVACGGNAYVSNENDDKMLKDEYEDYYQEFVVPPGRYLVTVYTHVPSMNGFRLTKLEGWEGYLAYYRKTRRKKMPSWIYEYAELEGEKTDDVDEDRMEEDDGVDRIGFVVQVLPAGKKPKVSGLAENLSLSMETRLPAKCPLGIKPIGIESDMATPEEEVELEREEAEEVKARFGDPKDLAEHFRPFAEALFQQQFEAASEYFIESLRQEAIQYMTVRRMRRRKWEPLHSIWLDRGKENLPSWRSNFEKSENLFAPDGVTESNYLGDVRCEYGSSRAFASGKINRYLIVDAPIVDTPTGPRLAGIYFSS